MASGPPASGLILGPPEGPIEETSPTSEPGAARRAFGRGLLAAAGVPSWVMAASFVGFGALVRNSGLGVMEGVVSTATAWAMPGQVALVELHAAGAPLLVIAAAVAFTNARLLPMTVTLVPHLRAPGRPLWHYYLAANWIAVTSWAETMRASPNLPQSARLPYFAGFVTLLWLSSLLATAAGHGLAGSLPTALALALVFLNPLYFMLVLLTGLSDRPRLAAMLLGALLGPPLHLLTPEWGLVLTGLLAGSLGFLIGRARGRPRDRHG